MTHNIAKIRAALEMARDYITSDLASERGAFEGYEGVSRIDEIKADLANNVAALAALAELERAAAPQFVSGEVTDDVAARVLTHFSNFPVRLSNAQNGHDMIAAVRSELGPALGLVTREEMAQAVKAAYKEGCMDCDDGDPDWRSHANAAWKASESRKRLEAK